GRRRRAGDRRGVAARPQRRAGRVRARCRGRGRAADAHPGAAPGAAAAGAGRRRQRGPADPRRLRPAVARGDDTGGGRAGRRARRGGRGAVLREHPGPAAAVRRHPRAGRRRRAGAAGAVDDRRVLRPRRDLPAMRGAWGLLAAARPRRIAELRRLDEQVRRPLALSTRVGFVGTAGGSGCSTAAGLAASVLARRRSSRVLAVNASGARRSLLWHAGLLSDATSTSAQDAERASASTAAEALAGLATAPSGLHGLDLTRVTPGDDTRWWEAVAPSSRFFDFVVTDWGVRDVGSLGHVATASSLLAIVLTPDREALQRTVEIAAAAHAAQVPSVAVVVPARGRAPWGIGEALRAMPVP